jgi:hypothetical protein
MGGILSIWGEICYLLVENGGKIHCNAFRICFGSHPPPPVDNNFGKFARKNVFDNSATIGKSGANFFPPPAIFIADCPRKDTFLRNRQFQLFIYARRG